MVKFKICQRIPKLNLSDMCKFWEREYSIFTMSAWRTTFDILNSKKWCKNGFNIFICIYQRGVATHFRSYKEEENFETKIGEKIINGNLLIDKIGRSHNLYAKHLINLFKQIERGKKFNLKFIKDFYLSFGKFTVFNTIIQRGIDYISKFRQYHKISNKLIKYRTKHEKILRDYDKYLEKMSIKIAKEKDFKYSNLLKLLTTDEYINFYKTGELPLNIKGRERISALVVLPTPLVLVGNSAFQLFTKLKNLEKHITKELAKRVVIKGTSVFPKKIKGKVQVISDLKKLNKFIGGYILVAPTTLPKYTQLLKKAKGLITDEGGLLSHAAVVSREFKIPCIVGTKIATKKLKTGQFVELDAVKGVIKIIK